MGNGELRFAENLFYAVVLRETIRGSCKMHENRMTMVLFLDYVDKNELHLCPYCQFMFARKSDIIKIPKMSDVYDFKKGDCL